MNLSLSLSFPPSLPPSFSQTGGRAAAAAGELLLRVERSCADGILLGRYLLKRRQKKGGERVGDAGKLQDPVRAHVQHQLPSAVDLRRLQCGGSVGVPAGDPSVGVSDIYAAVQLYSITDLLISSLRERKRKKYTYISIVNAHLELYFIFLVRKLNSFKQRPRRFIAETFLFFFV